MNMIDDIENQNESYKWENDVFPDGCPKIDIVFLHKWNCM